MGKLNKDLSNREVFCHDNLEIMQGMNSECVDLIYLDPPFNKNRKFTAPLDSRAAGQSFTDIFREKDVKDEWLVEIAEDEPELYAFLKSVEKPNKDSANYDYCYLCYMAIRLLEMHRLLKPTGTIYLHCDSTMNSYLRIVMDIIFGRKNFLNEIIWCYKSGGASKKQFAKKHDSIFFYAKSSNYKFNLQKEKSYHGVGYQTGNKNVVLHTDEHQSYLGPHTLVNMKDWWEISMLATSDKTQRTGWETQKPLPLLERIVTTSSNKGDLVFDPFCGCATTCVAAEKLGRQWIGIDKDPEVHTIVIQRLTTEVQQSTAKGKTQQDLYKDWNGKVTKSNRPPQRDDLGADRRKWKFVYVISNPKYKGEYKVGIAKDVSKRLNAYQASDPNRAYKPEFKFHTPFYRQIEAKIHNGGKFTSRHEWVEGDLKKIIAEIKSLHKKLNSVS